MLLHSRMLKPLMFVAAIGAAAAAAWALDIRLNTTASLPLGLYIATKEPTDYVAFCVGGDNERLALRRQYITAGSCPAGGTPLLKRIVARAGDRVRLSAKGIEVNGGLLPNTASRLRDSSGRALESAAFGDYTVEHGFLWVASTYSPLSLDSRYYAAVPASSIRLHVRPLWVTE
jgi:conjugative transfer signal peptidase TraF